MGKSESPKILILSDSGIPTGYGRIADELAPRLLRRGWSVMAASLFYDGLLPAQANGERLPYHVASLQGLPDWTRAVQSIVEAWQADVLLVIQDAPYAVQMRSARLDWSQVKFGVITPVDGEPIDPVWVELMNQSDGAMTISEFGMGAYARAGVSVGLCRPAVDLDYFTPVSAKRKRELRGRLGIGPGDFVLGTMCANQGRKLVPLMLEAFFTFATGKSDVYYLLDTQTRGEYNIPNMVNQQGWDESKLLYMEQVLPVLPELADRYRVLDAMQVVSSREGFGLPLVEAQAVGAVAIALDWCSGPEIVGNGKGILIPCADTKNISTWGGAIDRYPDMGEWVEALNKLYSSPSWRGLLAEEGQSAARAHTWDHAVDNVDAMLQLMLFDGRG